MSDTRAVRSRLRSSPVRRSPATVGDDGPPAPLSDMDIATELLDGQTLREFMDRRKADMPDMWH